MDSVFILDLLKYVSALSFDEMREWIGVIVHRAVLEGGSAVVVFYIEMTLEFVYFSLQRVGSYVSL